MSIVYFQYQIKGDKGKIFIDSFINNVIKAEGDCKMAKMNSFIEINKYNQPQKMAAEEMYCLQIEDLFKQLKQDYSINDIISYLEAQDKNLPGFFQISDDDINYIYFLKLSNSELAPFKLNNNKDKILSMSAMNKGSNQHYLIEY